jgi:hypothetical protein
MYISNNDEYGDWCLSSLSANVKEERQVEDTKGVIRSRKSKEDRQHKDQQGQRDKQRSAKQYGENSRSSNGNPVKTVGELRCTERIISSTFGTRLDR